LNLETSWKENLTFFPIFARPVTVIKLIGEKTIEEGMYRLGQEKLKLEEELGGRAAKSGNAEGEDSEEPKVDLKDVFRLLHDYLQLDSMNGSH